MEKIGAGAKRRLNRSSALLSPLELTQLILGKTYILVCDKNI